MRQDLVYVIQDTGAYGEGGGVSKHL